MTRKMKKKAKTRGPGRPPGAKNKKKTLTLKKKTQKKKVLRKQKPHPGNSVAQPAV